MLILMAKRSLRIRTEWYRKRVFERPAWYLPCVRANGGLYASLRGMKTRRKAGSIIEHATASSSYSSTVVATANRCPLLDFCFAESVCGSSSKRAVGGASADYVLHHT